MSLFGLEELPRLLNFQESIYRIIMIIIDGHTHFAGPRKGLPPNSVEELLSIMDANGIDAVVTTPPYSFIGSDRPTMRSMHSYQRLWRGCLRGLALTG